MSRVTLFSDGGARGNPGPAGAGVVILSEDGTILAELCKPLGRMTNNQAEYWGVVFALERLGQLITDGTVIDGATYSLDSQLIVEQLAGNYRVKNEGLKPLYDRVLTLLAELPIDVEFSHVPRRKNVRADQLANEAMDAVESNDRE